ncbi:response regulator [Candidatus Nitrosotenuis cloacae]|uniref:response regulator n=1 Tax=Candidatus Nitrosotenuis cloacae TaxID=1603555 RepID=UPI002281FE32|nr:response regulator [Candidatus Nitrosotenuis cloacae]
MTTAVVVDDDIDTVDVFCDYLKMKDVVVLGRGHNGKEAVSLYQTHKPDIVFLDLMMPEYDGFYALENIRRANPDSKIVVITADLRDETTKRLNMLKPTEIFIKPYDLDKIAKLLERLGN